MKTTQLLLFSALVAITSSCGSSSHFMKDDVYSTRTPMIPIGTDLGDETDYAVYAYKRERIEEKVEYTAEEQRWDNFRNSTVVFNNGWNYNRYSFGYMASPTFYVINSMPYMGVSYYDPANCLFMGYYGMGYYGNYGYYGYSSLYPYGYNGYYGYGNSGYNNWQYFKPFSQQSVVNSHSSSGSVQRGKVVNPVTSSGNKPRLMRTGVQENHNRTAVRSSASGSINSGAPTAGRSGSVRSNTAVRVNNSTNNNNNSSASGRTTISDRTSGNNNTVRQPASSPSRNTNVNTPNRGTSVPRSSSPSNGGSRPSVGTSPRGGARGTGR